MSSLFGWLFLFFIVMLWVISLYILVSFILPYFFGIMDKSDRFYRYMKSGYTKTKSVALLIIVIVGIYLTINHVRLDIPLETPIITSDSDTTALNNLLQKPSENFHVVEFGYTPSEYQEIIKHLRKELKDCQNNK